MKFFIATALALVSPSLFAESPHFYGRIKASVISSNKSVNSFGNANLSAPTSATYRDSSTASVTDGYQQSFQTAQSRLGMDLAQDKVNGNLEFDFIDFTKATPTTQAVPRVRRAFVAYQTEIGKFQLGQDWDTFSPQMPDTFDYVGLYFEAGNAGFMRQQLKWITSQAEVSLGFPGRNPAAANSFRERSPYPVLAANWKSAPSGAFVGFSGLAGAMKRVDVTGVDEHVYGLNSSFTLPTGRWTFKGELTYGQNLGKIAALTLADSTRDESLKEWLGYLNGVYTFESGSKIVFGHGIDTLIDDKLVGGSTTATLVHNQISRVAYAHKLLPSLDLWTEAGRFGSTYRKSAHEAHFDAYTLEAGLYFIF